MRNRLVVLVVISATALLFVGCSGNNNKVSETTVEYSTTPTGTVKAWAFENADDVGKARLEFAKNKFSGVIVDFDATTFDV